MYVFHMSFGLIVLDSCDGVLTYATIHNNCEFAAAGMDSERVEVSYSLSSLSKPSKTKVQNPFSHFLLVYCSLAHHYSGLDVTVLYESELNVLSVPCITEILNIL